MNASMTFTQTGPDALLFGLWRDLNARGHRIINLADGVSSGDAVTVGQFDFYRQAILDASGDAIEAAADAVEARDDTFEALATLEIFALNFDSIAAFRAATLSSIISTVHILGYYGKGTRGGGTFYLDPTDTTSADNGGTIIVKGSQRWKRPPAAGYCVTEFGAKCDNVTDDYPAVLQCSQLGLVTLFPDGITLLSQRVYVLNKPVIWKGASRVSSAIRCTGSEGAILQVGTTPRPYRPQDRSFEMYASHFSDLCFMAGRAGAGAAITIDNTEVFNLYPTVMGDNGGPIFDNLDFRGMDYFSHSTHYWNCFTHVVNTAGCTWKNVRGINYPNNPGSVGFWITATRGSVLNYCMDNISLTWCQTNLIIELGLGCRLEGLYCSNFGFVAGAVGLLLMGEGHVTAVKFSNGHMAVDDNCITQSPTFEGSDEITAIGCYFQLGQGWRGGSGTVGAVAINLKNSHGNKFIGNLFLGSGYTLGQSAFQLDHCMENIIELNQIVAVAVGVELLNDCFQTEPQKNKFGAGTVVTEYVGFTPDPRVRSARVAVTLNSEGRGAIPIPGPGWGGYMVGANVSNTSSAALPGSTFNIDWDLTTTTSLAVYVTPNPGAVTVYMAYMVAQSK